jgi:hypothetical protein
LRYVARAGESDPVMIAIEAAEALAGLGRAAQALVPSCRRLLEAHPTCAPLWWVSARMIVADDPRHAAYASISALEDDQTVEELAASFPAGASVVIPASRDLADAVDLRPDLSVAVVGSPYRLNRVFGRMTGLRDVIGIDQQDLQLGSDDLPSADLVVLDALAAGPTGILVDMAQGELLRVAPLGMPCWVRVGVGRLLPQALFDEVTRRVEAIEAFDTDDPLGILDEFGDVFSTQRVRPRRTHDEAVRIDSARLAAVVGPRGKVVPALGLKKSDCVAPAELLGFSSLSS